MWLGKYEIDDGDFVSGANKNPQFIYKMHVFLNTIYYCVYCIIN